VQIRVAAVSVPGPSASLRDPDAMAVKGEQNRFFDGDGDRGDDMVVELKRVYENDAEEWTLVHRIGYADRHYAEPFLVPKDKNTSAPISPRLARPDVYRTVFPTRVYFVLEKLVDRTG